MRDEKTQIQAIDRTAPCLPILPATPARRSHDYVRNGTTSLFAALNVATGQVIASHHRQHRHQEFLKFLKAIDATTPPACTCTYPRQRRHPQNPRGQELPIRHPRFHIHFVPTSSSWLYSGMLVRRAHQPQAAPLSAPQRPRPRS